MKHAGISATAIAGFLLMTVKWVWPELPDPGASYGVVLGAVISWTVGSLIGPRRR